MCHQLVVAKPAASPTPCPNIPLPARPHMRNHWEYIAFCRYIFNTMAFLRCHTDKWHLLLCKQGTLAAYHWSWCWSTPAQTLFLRWQAVSLHGYVPYWHCTTATRQLLVHQHACTGRSLHRPLAWHASWGFFLSIVYLRRVFMDLNLTFGFGSDFRFCVSSFCNIQKWLPLVVLLLWHYIVVGSDVCKPPPTLSFE